MKDFYFSNEEDEKNFLKNQKWLIHSLIVEGVKKSIKEGLDEIVLFRIINPISNFIMVSELKKDDWEASLSKSLEYFESVEEYERCGDVKKLLKTIKNGNNRIIRGKK
jgi:hypothetical protein